MKLSEIVIGQKYVPVSKSVRGFEGDYFLAKDLVPYVEETKKQSQKNTQKVMATKTKKFEVSQEFIREAYSAACSDWKAKIKKQFPEAFEAEIVEFDTDKGLHVTTDEDKNYPLYIGKNHAPDGLEGKCLVVKSGYTMKTKEHMGRTIIYFEKKY